MKEQKIQSYFKNNEREITIENADRIFKGSILFLAYLSIVSIIFLITKVRKELIITYASFLPFFIISFFIVLGIKKGKIQNKIFRKCTLYAFIIICFSFGFVLGLLDKNTNSTMLPIFMIIIPLFLIVNIYYIFTIEFVFTVFYLITSYLYKPDTIFHSELLNMAAVLLICIFIGSLHLRLRISEANANKTLNSLAKLDYLTTLPNRRSIDEYLNNQTNDKELYFMMIDIDGFKSINDTYGHLMGDEILQKMGIVLRKYMNEETIVSRYGGEEFLVVSNILNEQDLYKMATLIQEDLKKIKIDRLNDEITVSIGIGLSNIGEKYSQGIERADISLYFSKDSGKNQISIYNDNMKNIERSEYDYVHKE